jgi:tellurite resistance protein
MNIEDLKYIAKSKKETIFHCLLLLSYSDGEVTNEEKELIATIGADTLNLSIGTLKKIIMLESEPEEQKSKLVEVLQTMSNEELEVLGTLMGVLAIRDGEFDKSEKELMQALLRIGGLDYEEIKLTINAFDSYVKTNKKNK